MEDQTAEKKQSDFSSVAEIKSAKGMPCALKQKENIQTKSKVIV
jgi:hypothetical protein